MTLRLYTYSHCDGECITEANMIPLLQQNKQKKLQGMCFSWMGYCFPHCLPMTSKDTLWIFPEDESVVCFQMTVKHSESACFRSRPVIMLPWREIVRWLKKVLGKKRKGLLVSHETTLSRTFALWMVGVLPGKPEPISRVLAHFTAECRSRKHNLGGDLEELMVSMGVCVKAEPQAGIWLLLPAAAALQYVIPLDPATAAQESLSAVTFAPPFGILTERLNGQPCWHPGSGWESPGISKMTKQAWGKKQGLLINWLIISALVLFSHFKWVFQKAKTVKVTDF